MSILEHAREPGTKRLRSYVVQAFQRDGTEAVCELHELLELLDRQIFAAIAQPPMGIADVDEQSMGVEGHALPIRDDPGLSRGIDDLAQLAQRPAQSGLGIVRNIPEQLAQMLPPMGAFGFNEKG